MLSMGGVGAKYMYGRWLVDVKDDDSSSPRFQKNGCGTWCIL